MSDPIERLRAANPVPDPAADPSARPPRAVLQEILVTDTLDRPTTPPTPAPQPWWRSTRILAAAAAVVAVVAIGGAVLAGGGDGDAQDVAAVPPAPSGIDDPADEPLFPGDEPAIGVPPDAAGGTEVTSCVELYDLSTLTNREYAFDGTVQSVEGNDMTFAVNEWFSGGDGAQVTLDHQGYVGMLFAPDGPALEPGTRVLIAGDGGFVWSCGFTQLHDPALADEWRAAFAGA